MLVFIILITVSFCFAAADVAVTDINLDSSCSVQIGYKNVGTVPVNGDIEFKTFLDGTQKTAVTLSFPAFGNLAPGMPYFYAPGYKVSGSGTVKVVLSPKYKDDPASNNEMTKALTCKPATRQSKCAPKTLQKVKFDEQYLKSSFDTSAGPVNSNEVELTIDGSNIQGDFINCHYKSKNGDIFNLVYHYSCKGAVKDPSAPNTYICKN
ncbi:MAG: hypothetical protein EPN25_04415 [Nitrospirae bacterium]|nr:MAG: hypothetical protein EPN25_04415 [Nitrospirota bacterium]